MARSTWWLLPAVTLAGACGPKERPPRFADLDATFFSVSDVPYFAPDAGVTEAFDVGSGGSWASLPSVDAAALPDDAPTLCLHGATTLSPWQFVRATGPVCFGRTFTQHGDPAEFELARVPAADDRGWRDVAATTIDFSETSALCGRTCTCLDGGEFTYFQTFLDVADRAAVRSFVVTIAHVDDGARVTVFNDASPGGVTDPAAYVRLGAGGTTADLARYLVAGRNRVVITHLDDCCSTRTLAGVRLALDGAALAACE